MLPLGETRLIKIWQRKKIILNLAHFYADQFDCRLSLRSGEFEPCLAGVGNVNCIKSFLWNKSLSSFNMMVLKVKNSWANGLEERVLKV